MYRVVLSDEIMLHFYEMTGKRIQGQCKMEHHT